LPDPNITGVQKSKRRESEKVLMISSIPIPLMSPQLIPIIDFGAVCISKNEKQMY
jgi:hypothetical protein